MDVLYYLFILFLSQVSRHAIRENCFKLCYIAVCVSREATLLAEYQKQFSIFQVSKQEVEKSSHPCLAPLWVQAHYE